jgi:hypothetical protein
MNRSILAFTTLLSGTAFAQCDFDPQITPGETVILCPGESVILMAGEFDSYQWFMGDAPIPGATGHSHEVTYFDSGVSYSVEVTQDGCTEMSEGVLVDGFVFLPVTVIHGGEEPISIGPDGSVYCEGQEVILQLGMPYTESIVWTLDGSPIPFENSPMLDVTEGGVYHVSAAPADCPEAISQLGVTIEIQFIAPQQPEIQSLGDEICANPVGLSYMWYHNDELLEEETDACIMVSGAGAYSVYVDYGQDCQVISEPYIIMGIGKETQASPWMVYPNPTQGTMNIVMEASVGDGTFYSVLDVTGREVATGWMPLNGLLQLDLNNLVDGTYFFQAARDGRALAPATRFTVMK